MNTLKEKILNKQAKVGVIGLGYVGLPLALEFSSRGFTVFGLDIDSEKIKFLKNGKSYIKHIHSENIEKFVKEGLLLPENDFSKLKNCDCVIICVPTPLTENREPDMSFIVDTSETVSKYIHKGQLVILESTTYPGTTDEVVKPILEKSELKEGVDFYLAFSPEREDPGTSHHKFFDVPKVVGGISDNSTEIANLLYSQVVKKTVPVSSARVAESTKMLENTYRAVNIALVNELKMLFDKMGIDIWEVIAASSTKPFGFHPFYPGPGLGGHCIPIDPFYLTWKAKQHEFSTRFIELAGEINTSMPHYVISKVIEELNNNKKYLNGSKILILGIAYKKDVDDVRESPAIRLIELLEQKGAVVSYNDPFIPKIPKMRKHKIEKQSIELKPDKLKQFDCILIATDHSCYDYQMILENSQLIIDTRNAIKKSMIKSGKKVIKA